MLYGPWNLYSILKKPPLINLIDGTHLCLLYLEHKLHVSNRGWKWKECLEWSEKFLLLTYQIVLRHFLKYQWQSVTFQKTFWTVGSEAHEGPAFFFLFLRDKLLSNAGIRALNFMKVLYFFFIFSFFFS